MSKSIRVIRNTGGPKYPGRIKIELDRSIGDDIRDRDALLASPHGMEIDRFGRMYVMDAEPKSILVYGPDGGLIRKVGREGNGPGEFLSRPGFEVFAGGSMVTYDVGHRYAEWSATGDLRADHRSGDWTRMIPGWHRRSRSLPLLFYYPTPTLPTVADTATAYWIHKIDLPKERDTLVCSFPISRPEYLSQRWEGNNMGTFLPFATSPIIEQDHRGQFFVADCDSAKVRVFGEAFEPRMIVTWTVEREPLTKEECLAAYRYQYDPEALQDISPRHKEFRRNMDRWRETLEFPSVRPVICHLVIGLNGRIWIEKWGENGWAASSSYYSMEPDGQYDYWVFSSEGILDFQTTLPVRIAAADDEFLYEVYRGGEDDPAVRRWRWTPPNQGEGSP